MSAKETTVTKTQSRDDLLAEAAAAQARAAEINATINAEELKKHQARLEAQRQFDEQYVADYSRAAIEAEVADAKAVFDRAIADNPLVLALADYAVALRRRSHKLAEYMNARGRIGLQVAPPDVVVVDLNPIDETLLRAASRLADDRTASEVAAFHAERDNAGVDTEETN